MPTNDSTRSGGAAPVREVVVPIDAGAEQAVIAAMLVDGLTRTKLLHLLEPDRFQVPLHRAVVAALGELERRKVAYDPAALRRLFPELDIEYLIQLETARPALPRDLSHYVEAVQWDAARAEAVRGPISALLDGIKDVRAEPTRVRSLAHAVGAAFDRWQDRRYIVSPGEVLREMSRDLRGRREGRAVYPFGIEGLDVYEDTQKPRLIPGAKPGKITVITGVSGSGKSTLACRIALGLARQRRRALYGAWEMTGGESLELLAAMSLADEGYPISRTALQTGTASEATISLMEQRAETIGKYVRFVRNPFGRAGSAGKESNDRNLDVVHGIIADAGADVCIFDLWERCLVHDKPEDIQRALYRQQSTAETTKCHCILLQQQRLKDVEARADRRPTREGIKGTSAWVDIADTILGVHRPAMFKAVHDETVVVDILKQRYAPWPLSVELEWDPDRGWFGAGTSVPYDQPTGREDNAIGVGERF